MTDVEKFFDDTAMKSAVSLGMSNPAWLSKFAAETAIKADKFEKEITRLRAENEKLQSKCEFIYDELLEAKGQVEKIRAALKPFAYYAEEIPDDVSDTASASGTVGDLRAAKAALGGSDD